MLYFTYIIDFKCVIILPFFFAQSIRFNNFISYANVSRDSEFLLPITQCNGIAVA